MSEFHDSRHYVLPPYHAWLLEDYGAFHSQQPTDHNQQYVKFLRGAADRIWMKKFHKSKWRRKYGLESVIEDRETYPQKKLGDKYTVLNAYRPTYQKVRMLTFAENGTFWAGLYPVIGGKVQEVLLAKATGVSPEAAQEALLARYKPGKKNKPLETFLPGDRTDSAKILESRSKARRKKRRAKYKKNK